MPRTDFLFSIFLFCFGTAVMVESYRMPLMDTFGYGKYAAPGLVPGLVGAALAFLAVRLFIRSYRAGGSHMRSGPSAEAGALGRLVRGLGVALGLILIYAVVLVGAIPFWLATFLFVFVFIAFFEWNAEDTQARRLRRLGFALLQAVVVAVSVTLLFERAFLVRLPG